MADEIPWLRRKLNLLYARNRLYDSDEKLQKNGLNISSHNIKEWLRTAEDNENAGRIPRKHVVSIAELYRIRPSWMYLESLHEFESLLDANPYKAYDKWQELLTFAEPSDGITLKHGDVSRGLSNKPILEFKVGDLVKLSIDLRVIQNSGQNFSYPLLFVSDSTQTECIYPTPPRSIKAQPDTIEIPGDCRDGTFQITGPVGTQQLFLLLTRHPFDADIYHLLQTNNTDVLILIATQLLVAIDFSRQKNKPLNWLLYKRSYLVS